MQQASSTIPENGGDRPKAPDCLQSSYGAGNAKREEARKATARAAIGPGDRPQEIYTPQEIITAILKVWPCIALDPCTGPASLIPANNTCYVKPRYVSTASGKVKTVFRADESEIDGLLVRWPDYTYVNPPFALLKDWLCKARHEGEDSEVMMLAPARGNRRWFRDVTATCSKICDLDPIKFVGFTSAFPQALVMLYWGENTSVFEYAFERLGDCRS